MRELVQAIQDVSRAQDWYIKSIVNDLIVQTRDDGWVEIVYSRTVLVSFNDKVIILSNQWC